MSGTGDLANDLTELMVSLGQYAAQANSSICFCIDEVQYAKENELEAMITAVHRIDQLGLPIIFFCAGLPKVLKAMGDAKSYSERLFDFMEVGSLSAADARDAIIQPAKNLTVEYEDEAVERIIEITKGYPYFIQEVCNTVWKRHCERYITQNAVNDYLEEAIARLDTGFFKARYERCAQSDKKFVFAMVKCGELPCTIANVAKNLHKSVSSISTSRAQLISKGIIYPVRYKELDFTVPEFSGYIQRLDEYRQWCEED